MIVVRDEEVKKLSPPESIPSRQGSTAQTPLRGAMRRLAPFVGTGLVVDPLNRQKTPLYGLQTNNLPQIDLVAQDLIFPIQAFA